MEEWPGKSPSLVRKIRGNGICRNPWNSGKHFYFLMKANITYLVQMDVIVCGEYKGKSFGRKKNVYPTFKRDVGSVMV